MEWFETLAGTLPIEIKSARYLAKHFGSSVHAATRRYVETINKRCALIVLNKDPLNKQILFIAPHIPFDRTAKDSIFKLSDE